MSTANADDAASDADNEVTPGRIVVLNGPPPTAFCQLAERA